MAITYYYKVILYFRSYGVVLWEIVTYGEMPHPALNVQELMQLAEADKLCLEKCVCLKLSTIANRVYKRYNVS